VSVTPQRAEAVRRLDSAITALGSQLRQLRELRDFLMGDERRLVRDYDLPPQDSAAVAATFGVSCEVDGEAPEWFVERLQALARAREADTSS
jgi:hypothetical protein